MTPRSQFTAAIHRDGLGSLAQSARLHRVKIGGWILIALGILAVVFSCYLWSIGNAYVGRFRRFDMRTYGGAPPSNPLLGNVFLGFILAITYGVCGFLARRAPTACMTVGFVVFCLIFLTNLPFTLSLGIVTFVALPFYGLIGYLLARSMVAAYAFKNELERWRPFEADPSRFG